MTIVQMLPELNVGGVETGTVDIAKWLAQNGHKVIVISGGGRLVKQLEAAGVTHYQLPVGRKSPFSIIPMICAVRAIFKKEGVQLVHARSRIPALIAFFAARSTTTKATFITTAHGYYRRHPLSRVMGWGRFVIVASNVMARHMIENFGVPFERIRLIPRGVDVTKYHFRQPLEQAPACVTIGMISRLTPLKGHAYFLRAVASIFRRAPHIKVVIAGSVPQGKEKYQEELKLLCRRLGIAGIVEFIGHSDDVADIFKKLDMLVFASVVPEGFGRVIIEAQASGVPIVATRVGGVVDIVEDGVNGLLVNPRDPASLAEAVLKLVRDRGLAGRLSTAGRRSVEERFTLENMCRLTLSVYEEALQRRNLLVIKMSALGDVILSIPSLRALRQKFPDANIKVLVGLKARNALKGCPYINDTIVCDPDGKDRGLLGLIRVGAQLRSRDFDIVVDLQNNRASHILAFLSCSPLRFGYRNKKFGFLLNRGIKDAKGDLGPVRHQFRILQNLGITATDTRLEVWPSKDDEAWAVNFLASNWIGQRQTLVGINVGASDRWITKRWPLGNFAKLCDELSRRFGARVIITGIRRDLNDARRISQISKSKPITACGRTNITQLAALMRHCAAFVTGDSAPIHLAAAVGVPLVALFGPTDPKRHVPSFEDNIIIKKNLRCSPCYRPRCILNYRCMRKITVDEVVEAVEKLLKTKP